MTIELSPRLPDDERPSDYANLAAEQVDLENVINELLLRLTGWPNDHPDRAEARWPAIEGTLGVNQDACPERVDCDIHLQLPAPASGFGR